MPLDTRSRPSGPDDAPARPSELGEIFTPDEVAAYLKVSKKTVYQMLRRGELRAFKAGKHWRVPRDGLGALIARESGKSGEQAE